MATTFPDSASPGKVLFERLTAVMASPGVTLMARFHDVLAAHKVVGNTRTAKEKKSRKRCMFFPHCVAIMVTFWTV